MAPVHTHYDNLKVARSAPPEVIRAAYKALSQRFHPDRNPGITEAARIMAIINTSYDVLSDPEKRRQHDQWIMEVEAADQVKIQTGQATQATTQYSSSLFRGQYTNFRGCLSRPVHSAVVTVSAPVSQHRV